MQPSPFPTCAVAHYTKDITLLLILDPEYRLQSSVAFMQDCLKY